MLLKSSLARYGTLSHGTELLWHVARTFSLVPYWLNDDGKKKCYGFPISPYLYFVKLQIIWFSCVRNASYVPWRRFTLWEYYRFLFFSRDLVFLFCTHSFLFRAHRSRKNKLDMTETQKEAVSEIRWRFLSFVMEAEADFSQLVESPCLSASPCGFRGPSDD